MLREHMIEEIEKIDYHKAENRINLNLGEDEEVETVEDKKDLDKNGGEE